MNRKEFVFTITALNALPPAAPGNRDTYYDAKEPGLLIRVGPTGKKTFCVFKRIKNGPPTRVTLASFPDMTIDQARRKALQIKNEIAMGGNPAEALREKREEMTLGEAFEWFIEHHAIPNELKTVEGMRGDFERYLGAMPASPRKKHGRQRTKAAGSVNWQNKRLSAIKPSDVTRLKSSLAKESGKGAANHAVKLLRSIFNVLGRAKIFSGENPAKDVGILKIPSRTRFLQQDEFGRLLDVLDHTSNETGRDFILLAAFTGARKSNLMSMCWADINFDRAVWTIPDTKNGESVTIELSPEAVAILERRRGIDELWVFPGSGESGHMQSPKRGVATIFDKAMIKGARIHDLRRTLGSYQAINGSSLPIIGASLGHKSLASTLIYARLNAQPVRASVEKAAAAMMATKHPG